MKTRLLKYIHTPNEKTEQYASEIIDLRYKYYNQKSKEDLKFFFNNMLEDYKRDIEAILNDNYINNNMVNHIAGFNFIQILAEKYYPEYIPICKQLIKVYTTEYKGINSTAEYAQTQPKQYVYRKYKENLDYFKRNVYQLYSIDCGSSTVDRLHETFYNMWLIEERELQEQKEYETE